MMSSSAVVKTNSLLEYPDEKSVGDTLLLGLLDKYKQNNNPIQVDFRKLVDWIPYGERSSHKIHQYPAKLLPHIPAFFLSNNILSKESDLVLDPFGGSGTVMLEALLAGRNAISSDSNPLARLISKVKVTALDQDKLNRIYLRLQERIEKNQISSFQAPDVVNLDYWFHGHVIKQLSCIKHSIDVIQDNDLRDFFKVSFSNTIKKVSLADPWLSVPVRLKKEKYNKDSRHYEHAEKRLKKLTTINVYELFYKLTEANIVRISSLNKYSEANDFSFHMFQDARKLESDSIKIDDESVQLIITSPPYAGAQKYIRSSSLNLGWLDFCKSKELRSYDKLNIGREHYAKAEYVNSLCSGIGSADLFLTEIHKINPLRAHIAANYLLEMKDAFREMVRVMKSDGYLVLVSSANQICGNDFETHKYLSKIAIELGLRIELRLIDDIHSRGLMTKRNKTSGIINCEWVYVFKKIKNE